MEMIVCISLIFSHKQAQAKDLVVNTERELQVTIGSAQDGGVIKFGEQFPKEDDITVIINNNKKITIDAEKKLMKNRISIIYVWEGHTKNEPQLILKNFNFDGENQKHSGLFIS